MNVLNERFRFLAVLGALVLLTSGLRADLRLAKTFGDHMVLQRDQEISIWGWADAGKRVEVEFGGSNASATANGDGAWRAKLPAQAANSNGQRLIVSSGEVNVVLDDVLVGEVWVCGGQSNMEWSLRGSLHSDLELLSAADDQLRFLKVPHLARPKAQSDFPIGPNDRWAGWRPATDDDAQNCTAVGYYFARRLRQVLRVPVGLVDISWGGTMAQHWASQKSLSRIPEMKPYFDDFQTKMAKWNEGGGEEGAKKRYEAELKTWEAAKAAAEAEGKRAPRRPRLQGNPGEQRQPSGMFHAMVLPLAKLSVRGVLFYQGENNSFGTSWKPFYASFPSVVRDWREVFESPKMPFGIIQIAGWSNRRTMTYDMNHHTNVVREIQFDTWRKTPGTGLIVTYDTNSNGSIHPASKRPIGERSARWALAEVYSIQGARSKKAIEWKGPVYESMRVDNGKIIVSFEEDGARGLRLNKDDARGFYIAGADRVFRHAKARVQGREVVVWSDDVKEPVAVRYAVSNLPNGTLLNGRELPAYPFRTDDWPIVPHQSTGEYRRK